MKLLIDLRYSLTVSNFSGKYNGGNNFSMRMVRLLCKNRKNNNIICLCNEGTSEFLGNQFLDYKLVFIENKYINELDDNYDTLFIPQVNDSLAYAHEIMDYHLHHPETRIVSTIHDCRHDWIKYDKFDGVLKNGVKNNPVLLYIGRRIHALGINMALGKIAKISDTVLTVSNYSMQSIIKKYDVKKISLVYQEANTGFINNSININFDSKFILFVSAGRAEKNFIRTLLAFQMYKKNHNDDLRLIATGLSDEQIKKINSLQFINSRYEKYIDLFGYVSESKLTELYNNCYFLLFTSFSEGFGLPVLEASLHGIPCVLSRTTSIPEVVGNAAIYVDPKSVESIELGIHNMVNDYKFYKHIAEENINNLKNRISINDEVFCHEILDK